MSTRSARPGTSTPSQKESVPSRIAVPESRKRRSSRSRWPSPCTRSCQRPPISPPTAAAWLSISPWPVNWSILTPFFACSICISTPATPAPAASASAPARARARRRAGARREARRGGVEPAHHAPQLADELRPPLARVVERQAVGDGLHAVPQPAERDEQVVERDAQALGPDRVARELVTEPQHARRSLLAVEPAAEVREYLLGRAARRVQGVTQALLDQVAARRAEQVVPPPQQDLKRGQEAAPAALEPRQQPVHAHHAHLRAQVGRRHVLEVVRLVEHQPPVGRQHGGFLDRKSVV